DAGRRLEVRGEAGVRGGLDADGPERAGPDRRRVDVDPIALGADRDAGFGQDVEELAEVVAGRALEGELATRHRTGHDERAGLDAVRDDPVVGAAQPPAPGHLAGV